MQLDKRRNSSFFLLKIEECPRSPMNGFAISQFLFVQVFAASVDSNGGMCGQRERQPEKRIDWRC